MSDRITAFACVVGAAALWFMGLPSADGRTVEAALAFGVGAWGLSRATGSRALVGVAVVMAFASLVPLAPSMIPRVFLDDYEVRATLATIFGTFAQLVFVGAIIATLVVIRARVGGVALLPIAPMVLGLLARGIAAVTDADTYSTRDVHELAESTWLGLTTVAFDLVVLAWILAGLAPLALPPRAPSGPRAALVTGAIGGMLTLASMTAVGSAESFGAVGTVLTMGLGWALVAVGLAGFARSGAGPAAWAALGLVVLELLVCPVMMFVASDALDHRFAVILLPSMLGLAGLAIATLGAREVPFVSVRRIAGVLFVVATLGTCLTTAGLAASIDAIGLRLEDPFWGVDTLMLPAMRIAFLLWVGTQALLGAPPAEAAPSEAPAMALPPG